ncbi:LADA_0E01442g1_1 [Lachancea dasiensis]|uniref:GPI ethanolamine phosphate transferase 2 n=1 Tax=Lachancea dasiensis TaxID=1072105 RepID=A0A1G4JAB4_9SACH|nr:LADA_0E01442g1_1 [Lachancea dasiensis]
MYKLVVLLVAQIFAILTFSAGFFPQKSVSKGDAWFTYRPDIHEQIEPRFGKLILVVVDALRSDYLFNAEMSQFSFVHELLNKGHAWGYTTYANPPTVTLPRLKGITTGSTPNFLDAILNVAGDDSSSSLKDQDSWLRQFHTHHKKINFFGDDTWLKLFPEEYFGEIDGTNSFFVSDFEEVDLNVTRHLPRQLASQASWDVLILHYLGLDHIGHKGGAFSSFMPPKHREMDSVIQQIYEAVDEDTLLCVMGDHGMNDMGNHGGSSAGETAAGLVLISKMLGKFEKPARQKNVELPLKVKSDDYKYLTSINQIDLVPTIATVFNFPIPKDSIGVVIPDILQLFSPQEARVKLLDNYYQLTGSTDKRNEAYENIFPVIEEMRSIQNDLAKVATDYNYYLLGVGLLVLVAVTSVVLIECVKHSTSYFELLPTFATTFLLSLSTFGSSFVEEEHQLWWWGSIALAASSYIKVPREILCHVLILSGLRLIRGWNNSGQKYVYEYTMSELLKCHHQWLWVLNTITIFSTQLSGQSEHLVTQMTALFVSSLSLVYKAAWSITNGEPVPFWLQKICFQTLGSGGDDPVEQIKQNLVPTARLLFFAVFVLILIEIARQRISSRGDSRFFARIHSLTTAIMILQTSSTNIPQYLIFGFIAAAIETLWSKYYGTSIFLLMNVGLVLQHLTFFQFGSTNSIATVDLTNAYNGVSENYNIHIVGLLMCLANFAPSIYWSLACLRALYAKKRASSKWETFGRSRLPALLFYCIFGCFLLASCVIQRYHLFIWSVFSPKLCYYVSWNLFMNAIISWSFESVLVALY